jgi:glucokinase
MGMTCAIGVDIGGTFTKIALVQADGRILRQAKLPTAARQYPEPYLNRLVETLGEFTLHSSKPAGIGLALPGFLSEGRRSIIFNPNTPALVGIDFPGLLEPLGLALQIDQDLNAPAVAEYHLGAGRGSRRFLSASIGTGLGAAVIIDGELLRFSSHTVGDSGHVILDPNGPRCRAGCRGCAEALVTTQAVERSALLALDDPRATRLQDAYRDGRVPAQAVISACREGDPLAVEIMGAIGGWLGQWLASLAPIFLPEKIVLCGGVAEAGISLLAVCRERFMELAGPEYTHCDISLSRFGGLAGVIGAATPFLLER